MPTALAALDAAHAGRGVPGQRTTIRWSGSTAASTLLRRLGEALRAQPEVFAALGQPGHLFDALTHHRHAPELHTTIRGRRRITR